MQASWRGKPYLPCSPLFSAQHFSGMELVLLLINEKTIKLLQWYDCNHCNITLVHNAPLFFFLFFKIPSRRNLPQKAIYDKPTANIILNGERLKTFPLRSTRQGCPLLPLLFNIKLENSEREINSCTYGQLTCDKVRPPDLPLEKPICRSGSNS